MNVSDVSGLKRCMECHAAEVEGNLMGKMDLFACFLAVELWLIGWKLAA